MVVEAEEPEIMVVHQILILVDLVVVDLILQLEHLQLLGKVLLADPVLSV